MHSIITTCKVIGYISLNGMKYLYDKFVDKYILSEDELQMKHVRESYNNWDKFIVNTCESIKHMNIFYIKALQAASADCDHFSSNVRDYMDDYSDNVPYNPNEFDIENIKCLLKSRNIKIGDVPIASGTVACVFKGEDKNKIYAIKVKRNDIDIKIDVSCKEMRDVIRFLSYLPVIKHLNLLSTFDENLPYIYEQLNFESECSNIKRVYQANKRNSIYITPNVYHEDITEQYKNIIIMDFLDGLKLKEVPDVNKDKFCSLVAKFGIKSIFFDGFTHGDLHQGNCRFLIDKDDNDNDVEKLIIYDFGILCYIKEDEKDIMYRVCKNFFAKKYDIAGKIMLDEITGPDEIRDNLSEEDYNALLEVTTSWSRDTIGKKKIVSPMDIHNLSVNLSKYNLKTKDWFGKIIMSFAVHESMAKALSVNKTFLEYAEELVKETEDLLG